MVICIIACVFAFQWVLSFPAINAYIVINGYDPTFNITSVLNSLVIIVSSFLLVCWCVSAPNTITGYLYVTRFLIASRR